jgi:hypothetical protein
LIQLPLPNRSFERSPVAITEATRHKLYQRLEAVLGHDEATILMEHLPPVGWADVATKRDVDDLRAATKHDLDDLRAAIAAVEERLGLRMDLAIERALRQQTYRLMGFFTAMMAVTVAAVRI